MAYSRRPTPRPRRTRSGFGAPSSLRPTPAPVNLPRPRRQTLPPGVSSATKPGGTAVGNLSRNTLMSNMLRSRITPRPR